MNFITYDAAYCLFPWSTLVDRKAIMFASSGWSYTAPEFDDFFERRYDITSHSTAREFKADGKPRWAGDGRTCTIRFARAPPTFGRASTISVHNWSMTRTASLGCDIKYIVIDFLPEAHFINDSPDVLRFLANIMNVPVGLITCDDPTLTFPPLLTITYDFDHLQCIPTNNHTGRNELYWRWWGSL